ncbi:Type II secretion system protein F [Planctomycetes bacterium Pan216]|uniref:Type II secretion system protein F n=1 Tax=Kolteria novifilia TaxID=2527975 RepID=A0A518AZX9_9BACT|nr:Type II secretion system protein F [Planctomycetes bacterium Pan216]
MPTFQFEAMDSRGEEVKETIEAASTEEAQALIRKKGYFVTKITEKSKRKKKKKRGGGKKKRGFVMGGVSSKKLTTFTRQLSTLQDAGLPVLRSLQILESQMKPSRLKYTLEDVVEDIESGLAMSEAFAKHPKVFDRLYVNMVKAGEAGGALEVILQRLADFKEKAQSLKRKVIGAMVYPVVVLMVASSILFFILYYIVPKFKTIFADFGLELPAMTQFLIDASTYVVDYWWTLPLIPFLVIVGIKLTRKFYWGRAIIDWIALRIPISGGLTRKVIVARTTRTLGTLVASGVPILECLIICRDTSNNFVFERAFQKVYDSIREGESIASPLRETRVVDEMVINMIDVGEETGDLDTMLFKVADVYDEEVDVAVESLVSLLEPLMVVILGLMVGFIVIALFLPLIKLLTELSG